MMNRLVSVSLATALGLVLLLLAVLMTSHNPGASAGAPPQTPTPTATPAAPAFHVGIDTNGDASDDCDTNGGATSCIAGLGTMVRVRVYLDDLGDLSAYAGMYTKVDFSGLTFPEGTYPDSIWPGCFLEAGYNGAPAETACIVDTTPVSYTGVVANYDFNCTAGGDVSLVHGPTGGPNGNTYLVDQAQPQNRYFEGDGISESLSISCIAAAAYPADGDGDNCPDAKEPTSDATQGGQRNFYNSWDYFNPTHDHQNRIDDVVAVLDQYFVDQGDPSYTVATDRTYIGPHPWNLGAPNGLQRIDDILNALKQYYHDCS